MTIKTKKYQLETRTYIKLGLLQILKEQWFYAGIPLAICLLGFFSWWFILIGVLVFVLYMAFWLVQFVGITQMPDSKVMFDKYMYEIDSRFIMLKINQKQGMQIEWNKIVSAEVKADAYILKFSKAQFFYLPFIIFNSESDIKFMEMILKRKELIK